MEDLRPPARTIVALLDYPIQLCQHREILPIDMVPMVPALVPSVDDVGSNCRLGAVGQTVYLPFRVGADGWYSASVPIPRSRSSAAPVSPTTSQMVGAAT